ncbi:hypothetical protein ACFVWG_14960 [Kribbella sp. NPDC058245]|uniref:hypothetical protein n=1 Tax=Kribbella sp. NPDC058245 TaxID=3346399 RepID=UPI0036E1E650
MDVRRTAKRLLIGGALAAVIGLVGAMVTDSATKLSYQIMVAEPGASGRLPACKPTVLFVDRTSGKELPCSGTPEGGYTNAERQEILQLAATMAADGTVDAVDGFKLSELGTEIGLRHHDATNTATTWAFGTVGILGAAAFVTGIVLRLVANARRKVPGR